MHNSTRGGEIKIIQTWRKIRAGLSVKGRRLPYGRRGAPPAPRAAVLEHTKVHLEHTNVHLYPDDTVIYAKNKDIRISHNDVQRDLNKVLSWCNYNQLTINIAKTKVILFGTNNMIKKVQPPPILMGNRQLQYVTSFNYLGIKLDNKLNFELHAQECARHVSHKIYTLTTLRSIINQAQALCLFKRKILPYFDYGDIFYNKTFSQTTVKLQKLQNRALKSYAVSQLYQLYHLIYSY